MGDSVRERILGIDLGTNSIGWALIDYENSEPKGIAGIGVRVFEAGVTGDIQSGRDESRNKARREKRLQRRQFDRRARRLANVARLLQEAGLLPAGDFKDKQVLHDTLMKLDRELYQRYASTISDNVKLHRTFPHVLPYWLRARALDQRLAPDELGRALYHLAQRRGFLSNRKATGKKESEEERGAVKKGIAELEHKMEETGARTLGEYFAGIDPNDERIRSRWTARKMYEHEFESIWTAQAPHHAGILTEAFKRKLHRAIFKQRPLKIQKNLIGKCELEPGQRRAPWATLEAQRFRLLQKVNDFQILQPDGLRRTLTDDERKTLLNALELDGDQTFKGIRTLFKLPKGTKFSHEAGGEEKLPGNRTASKLYAIFGGRWFTLTDEEKARIVEDVRSIRSEEVLARRGRRMWGLDEDKAAEFGVVSLQDEYCSLSKRALGKILPLMEAGEHYMTALEKVYPERRAAWNVLDALPAVAQAPLGELRNPMVERSLNELRKVINGIVKKYGKPGRIRIELARDLKKNRKDRENISRKNRDNEKGRSKAAKSIFDETGIQNPKRDAVERVLLAEECNWECPYTGRRISMGALLGETPQFDVEHIIPFSRCLDNSFLNKTLCYHEENRSVKKNKTPFEAYGGNEERWAEILERVRRFQGSAARAKLERFRTDEERLKELEDFSSRQLNDTRYASRLASDFLGLLYGGRIDAGSTQRIQAGRGQVTAFLRDVWNLNRILGDGGMKSRDDHRHHAVDAIVIALTEQKTVKMLSDAAWRAPEENRRRFAAVKEPWNGFHEDVKKAIDGIIVSHRVDKRVNGPLHEETIYGYGRRGEKGVVHVRKPLANMSAGEIESIADPVVRGKVKAALDGGDPKKVFADPKNHPAFELADGTRIAIHKARIKKKASPFKVGQGYRERAVVTDSNHHIEILEVTDKKGNVKWDGADGAVVSRFEAMQRLRRKEPIIRRDDGNGTRFLFSLSQNDIVQMRDIEGQLQLYRVTGMSQFTNGTIQLSFQLVNDARQISKVPKEGRTRTPDRMRQSECAKVQVTPLGEIRRAND